MRKTGAARGVDGCLKRKVFLKNQKHQPNIVEITHLCIGFTLDASMNSTSLGTAHIASSLIALCFICDFGIALSSVKTIFLRCQGILTPHLLSSKFSSQAE
jgi:hypothetical protein